MQQNQDHNSEPEQEESFSSQPTKQVRSYAKYSGLVIQMAIFILIGAYGGKYLDDWMETPRPYFTMVGSLLGIGGALYIVIKDIMRPK